MDGWLTLLNVQEYGLSTHDLGACEVVSTHHVLFQASPPPWDHGNAHAARALVRQGDAWRGRLPVARSVQMNLEAMEADERG
jgi:hypothetical protein